MPKHCNNIRNLHEYIKVACAATPGTNKLIDFARFIIMEGEKEITENEIIAVNDEEEQINVCDQITENNTNPEISEICKETEEQEEQEQEFDKPSVSTILENDCSSVKKSKMRTASDVISRILWDPDLPSENFVVGYLDRFTGLTEKPFQFFSWEDLASVDYNVLAIPKHRIVYFKYRHVKVWDKTQRLDLIFRSTVNKDVEDDIRELIKKIDEENAATELQKIEFDQYSTTDADSTDDYSESEESEMGVTIGRFPHNTDFNLPAVRPNYFLAIRVTDPDVIKNVQLVKEHINEKEPRLMDLMMPDASLHITLAMLKLDDNTEVINAHQAIQQCREKLIEYFTKPIVVRLKGMTTFNGYVLYVQVNAPAPFYNMHKSLLKHLTQCKVRLAHEFDFVPHLTILKLTRSRGKQLQNPYVDPYVYVKYKELDFGEQVCDNLHLCEIGTSKRWDGFYNCASEIHFT